MSSEPQQAIRHFLVPLRAARLSAALIVACLGVLGASAAGAQSPTLDAITKRGELLCSGATVIMFLAPAPARVSNKAPSLLFERS